MEGIDVANIESVETLDFTIDDGDNEGPDFKTEEYVHGWLKLAIKCGVEYEWWHWFLMELKSGATPEAAAWAAACEWDVG
jgi:hypothetical protein